MAFSDHDLSHHIRLDAKISQETLTMVLGFSSFLGLGHHGPFYFTPYPSSPPPHLQIQMVSVAQLLPT